MTSPEVRVLRRREDVVVSRIGNLGAIIEPDGTEHVVNATALALWELCDGTTRPDEMIEAICVLFDVRRETVTRDIEQTLAQFERARLIEWHPVDRATGPPITSAAINASFIARPKDSVETVDFDGEGVLYDASSGTVCTLSPVATVVWNCFDGTATIGEIAVDLSEAYGTDVAQVLDEVIALTRTLVGQGMLG